MLYFKRYYWLYQMQESSSQQFCDAEWAMDVLCVRRRSALAPSLFVSLIFVSFCVLRKICRILGLERLCVRVHSPDGPIEHDPATFTSCSVRAELVAGELDALSLNHWIHLPAHRTFARSMSQQNCQLTRVLLTAGWGSSARLGEDSKITHFITNIIRGERSRHSYFYHSAVRATIARRCINSRGKEAPFPRHRLYCLRQLHCAEHGAGDYV